MMLPDDSTISSRAGAQGPGKSARRRAASCASRSAAPIFESSRSGSGRRSRVAGSASAASSHRHRRHRDRPRPLRSPMLGSAADARLACCPSLPLALSAVARRLDDADARALPRRPASRSRPVIDIVGRDRAAGRSREPVAAPSSHRAGVGPPAGHRRACRWGDAALPGRCSPQIPDPPLVLWMRGDPAAFDAALGRHRRLPRRDALRPRGGVAAGRRPRGGRRAGRQRPGARRRFGRPPRRPRGRWPDGGRPRLGAGRRLSAGARRARATPIAGRRRRAERVAARHAAARRSTFPRAQPHHQRALAGRGRGRGGREERVAHHRRLRTRAGARRDGGARQHPVRTASRVPRPDPGRRRGRRIGRRRPGRTPEQLASPGGAGAARRQCRPTNCWPACTRARATTWSRSGAKPASRRRSCCRGCWGWNCRAWSAGLTGGGSFGPAERANVGLWSAEDMPKSLVIVESPAKAKTLSRFLGSDYRVEASFGHIRDLPESAERGARRDSRQAVGQPGRRHRRRLQALLRRPGRRRSATSPRSARR